MTKPSFVFRDRISFWWPVTVRLPEDGAVQEVILDAEFLMLPEDELFAAPIERADEEPAPTFRAIIETDRERLRTIWTGMRGVEDENGEAVLFSPETRDAMLAHRHVRIALNAAYNEAMIEKLEERSGN